MVSAPAPYTLPPNVRESAVMFRLLSGVVAPTVPLKVVAWVPVFTVRLSLPDVVPFIAEAKLTLPELLIVRLPATVTGPETAKFHGVLVCVMSAFNNIPFVPVIPSFPAPLLAMLLLIVSKFAADRIGLLSDNKFSEMVRL